MKICSAFECGGVPGVGRVQMTFTPKVNGCSLRLSRQRVCIGIPRGRALKTHMRTTGRAAALIGVLAVKAGERTVVSDEPVPA